MKPLYWGSTSNPNPVRFPNRKSAHMDATPIIRLADLELFADCSKAELRQIESLTTHLHLEQDRVLMREGSPAKEFIIIGSGSARISRRDR